MDGSSRKMQTLDKQNMITNVKALQKDLIYFVNCYIFFIENELIKGLYPISVR